MTKQPEADVVICIRQDLESEETELRILKERLRTDLDFQPDLDFEGLILAEAEERYSEE